MGSIRSAGCSSEVGKRCTGKMKFSQKLGFSEDRLDSGLQNSQIVSKLLKVLSKGDICLIKGSRAVRLDEVVKRIIKK